MKLWVTFALMSAAAAGLWAMRTATPALAQAPEVEAVSLETYLQGYWGDRWSKVRPLLSLRPCDAKLLVRPDRVPAWETVRQKLEPDFLLPSPKDRDDHRAEATSWFAHAPRFEQIDARDPEFNPEHKTIRPEDLERIRAIVKPFDTDLVALADWSADRLAQIIQRIWAEESFWRCPFVTVDPPTPPGRHPHFLRSYTSGVWRVSFKVNEGDDPAYDATLDTIEDKKSERLAAVHAFLHGLP